MNKRRKQVTKRVMVQFYMLVDMKGDPESFPDSELGVLNSSEVEVDKEDLMAECNARFLQSPLLRNRISVSKVHSVSCRVQFVKRSRSH